MPQRRWVTLEFRVSWSRCWEEGLWAWPCELLTTVSAHPRSMGTVGRVGPGSACIRGFRRREARAGPGAPRGPHMVKDGFLLFLLQTENPSPPHMKTILSACVAPFSLNVKLLCGHASSWPRLWEDRSLAGMLVLWQMESLGHKEG